MAEGPDGTGVVAGRNSMDPQIMGIASMPSNKTAVSSPRNEGTD